MLFGWLLVVVVGRKLVETTLQCVCTLQSPVCEWRVVVVINYSERVKRNISVGLLTVDIGHRVGPPKRQ
jgi:hypothetical protein